MKIGVEAVVRIDTKINIYINYTNDNQMETRMTTQGQKRYINAKMDKFVSLFSFICEKLFSFICEKWISGICNP